MMQSSNQSLVLYLGLSISDSAPKLAAELHMAPQPDYTIIFTSWLQ